MKINGYLFLTMFVLSPCLAAETWGIPRFEERKLSLTNTGPVAQEIIVNQVMNQPGNKFDGVIRLLWADDRYSDSARQLRQMLIQKGISPERIILKRKSGGYQNNAVTGVEVWVRRIVMRLPECEYSSQNYRFNKNEIQGCALNNTRNSAVVILNDYLL